MRPKKDERTTSFIDPTTAGVGQKSSESLLSPEENPRLSSRPRATLPQLGAMRFFVRCDGDVVLVGGMDGVVRTWRRLPMHVGVDALFERDDP